MAFLFLCLLFNELNISNGSTCSKLIQITGLRCSNFFFKWEQQAGKPFTDHCFKEKPLKNWVTLFNSFLFIVSALDCLQRGCLGRGPEPWHRGLLAWEVLSATLSALFSALSLIWKGFTCSRVSHTPPSPSTLFDLFPSHPGFTCPAALCLSPAGAGVKVLSGQGLWSPDGAPVQRTGEQCLPQTGSWADREGLQAAELARPNRAGGHSVSTGPLLCSWLSLAFWRLISQQMWCLTMWSENTLWHPELFEDRNCAFNIFKSPAKRNR